jgi:putative ABC transport system permease protein
MSRAMRVLILALRTQLATYRARFWEPLLIIVAIFIASAGLTAVTLINAGASSQLKQFTLGDVPVNFHIIPRNENKPLRRSDYAELRRQGVNALVAYTQTGDRLAVDTVTLFNLLPMANRAASQQNSFAQQAALNGIEDINQFYQGDVTLQTHQLSGLLVMGALSTEQYALLEESLPAHLQLAPFVLTSSANNLSDSFSLNLWAMGALMVLVSIFIVFNAFNLLLAARTPVLVKLRQLGVGQALLLRVLQLEMLILALVGAVGGVIAGASLVSAITPLLSNIYRFLLDGQFSGGQFSTPRLMLLAVVFCAIAVMVMGLLIRQRLAHSLARRSYLVAAFKRRFKPVYNVWLLLSLAIVALGAWLVASQREALLYIGLVLIAGCTTVVLLMPQLMSLVARRVSTTKPLLHWSMHNAVSLSQRTRLAACAFFIALAANIGMNVMVDSFRQATEQWLEQRLFAPFYIYTDFDGDLSAEEGTPVPLLARYGKDVRVNGQTLELRSFPDGAEYQQYLMLDNQLPSAWSAFHAQRGVFINQQLAYRQGLNTGDVVSLPLNTGLQAFEIVGVYPDYGNPKAQVLLPEALLCRDYALISAYAAFASPAEQAALESWLKARNESARLIPRETLIEQSMRLFSRTFLTTDTLNLITMLVAALSFFVSITLLVMDIKPQLLLLRSVGVSPFRIKLSLFSQYCFIAVSCALLALPFALLLAWLLVNKVNRFAFHWTYPLILDPMIIMQSLLIGLGLLLLLMALPLGRLQARFYSQQEAV